ncbi:hypothetical protein [Rhodococcus sp. KRD162]|nr:hypothetical protein [Rhodococcus sp. KRD162]
MPESGTKTSAATTLGKLTIGHRIFFNIVAHTDTVEADTDSWVAVSI